MRAILSFHPDPRELPAAPDFYGRTRLDVQPFGEYPNSGQMVRFPCFEAFNRVPKGLMSVAEVHFVAIVTETFGSIAGEGSTEVSIGRLGSSKGLH